jgi:hypothetical protein
VEFEQTLRQTGTDLAVSAVDSFLEDRWAVFALHAGTAVELLAKARLARRHPSLIVKDGHFKSLLAAIGHTDLAAQHVRTIGALQACERVAAMDGQFASILPSIGPILDLRNGTAHLGAVDKNQAEALLPDFLRAIELLVEDPDGFWGERSAWVIERVNEAIEAQRAMAIDAIEAARSRWTRRIDDLGEGAIRALVDNVVRGLPVIRESEKTDLSVEACPVCTTPVIVYGTTEVEWEPDVSVEGGEAYISGGSPGFTFYPSHLLCSACGLELQGLEAMLVAGLEPWEIDIDPADYFEPDEDW